MYNLVTSLTKDKIKALLDEINCSIIQWLEEVTSGSKEGGYTVGKLIFDVVLTVLTAGGASAKYGLMFYEAMQAGKFGSIGTLATTYLAKAEKVASAAKQVFRCKILGKGCFVKDTPVLMASNTLRNTTAAYAMAALPIVAVPIQDVQLLDYALAHKTVNASYGLTANANDTYILAKDPYTSDQQRSRDQYTIDDEHIHEVVFEEVNGTSICKLALHDDWIHQHNYIVDVIVNMNLPEQGISGPFRITSIKHIIPQKKPVDEDESDVYPMQSNGEWEYRPVTGLFIPHSDQVHTITFDNNETLGVTAPHPIFSTTHNDWRLASELVVGEKVLTYHGEATVTSTEKKGGSETVYNLEVKDLHNFLVGDLGIVVHNACISGGKKLCPPPKSKNLVSSSKISNWINSFNKRTPIKGDSNAAWYKYQERIAGDTEFEIPVPGSTKKMWADGFDAGANALVDTKHTASNNTFDIEKYLKYEENPGSVQPWEKGIFETLDDEMDKYSKIINSNSNDIAELHIKISGDKSEARALFTYLGGKFDCPVKVIHAP